ncbi:MAG: penicillin-binding protein 2 [Gemmatimonadetes bacterium]|nr:penicillin-binding protein 2 [Gemmatimonadota bacterium]MYE70977.1 penicillin-binding protein 2 [Gemmatimonadota bacterium]MYJ67539.1 penicillin-binding protein 2 [Gemmatimonadota bacterium]
MKGYDQQRQKALAKRARVVVFALLGLLVAAFFRAQVSRSSDWLLRSESNRLRSLTLPAPRGIIRDRTGRPMADNIPGYSVSILPAQVDSMLATLNRLREHMEIGEERFQRLEEQVRARGTRPLIVSMDASFDEVAAMEERRTAFPQLLIETRPKRRYPAGRVGAHIVGSVGEINEEELSSEEYEGVEPGRIVGRSGLEAQYDALLQGTPGLRYVEVDASERIVGSFGGIRTLTEEPGSDIDLNVDLELMEWIHHIFPDSLGGSVVVLDVETGGVLALYSAPAYDPNVFAGVVDPAEWARLERDPVTPLYHRAVMGTYPPGSPWKLATAAIALETGAITPTERMPVPCTGSFRYGNRVARCWDEEGHGSLTLAGAIQHSCNVFFYQAGLEVGLEQLLERANRMGFGDRCGIDLPNQATGTFPADVSFWEERFGARATEGEVLNLAIGQGPNDQSPLKMAQFVVALARDGSAPSPTLYRSAPAEEAWRLEISEESLDAIREGLRRVMGPGGTAHLSSLEHFEVLGKTGTAQSVPGRETHAWFTGMAGRFGEAPDIVVVALVEYGGSGSTVAAPLATKTADYFLRGEYGIPRDTIQTLLEYYNAGRSTQPWVIREGR